MSKKRQTKTPLQQNLIKHPPSSNVLNEDILVELTQSVLATEPAVEVAARLKSNLMQKVKENAHDFVFAKQGQWQEIYQGVEIKLLRNSKENKSFIIKMSENSCIPAHLHHHHEASFVIDGSVSIEGILCHQGDYHYALAGSQHGDIESKTGCTILVNTHL